jgi:hypothetical protein
MPTHIHPPQKPGLRLRHSAYIWLQAPALLLSMTIRGDLTQTQATGVMQKQLEKAVAVSLGVSPSLVELTSAAAAAATVNATKSRRQSGGTLTINFRVLAANAEQLASLQNKVALADFTKSVKKVTGRDLIVSSVTASMEEISAPESGNMIVLIAAVAGSVGGVCFIALIVGVVIYKRRQESSKMLPVTATASPATRGNLVFMEI